MRRWFDPEERERRWQVARLALLLHGLSRALRSGKTLPASLQAVADDATVAGAGLRRAARRVHDGSPVHEEIDRWATALADRDADLVRAVVNTGAATGSALAASFDRAAASLRERADLQREIAALTAQARASAMLLTLAPVAFLGVLAMADPRVVAFVSSTGVGRLAVVGGVVLDVVGWLWMRRLTAAVDP
ncbi:MAG: type II secretion system F family protein [Acidimicrobiales bacterium]